MKRCGSCKNYEPFSSSCGSCRFKEETHKGAKACEEYIPTKRDSPEEIAALRELILSTVDFDHLTSTACKSAVLSTIQQWEDSLN